MPSLFSSLQLGPFRLPNRVFMAPLTRCRAGPGRVPTPLMARYYAQRSSAGLLISEATSITHEGCGYPDSPGIWTPEHVAGWRTVTDAVHGAGGRIFCQLWHVGRVSHPAYQPDGRAPVSSSPLARQSPHRLPDGSTAMPPPARALELAEIPRLLNDYRHAARSAMEAGFDGVELHGANGYLLEQFLRSTANTRTDRYGGSIENRARLHLEAAAAIAEVVGPHRVGVRLSPSNASPDIRDASPRDTFGYVVAELARMELAYLHIMEAMESDHALIAREPSKDPRWEALPIGFFRDIVRRSVPASPKPGRNVLITNAGFTRERAIACIAEDHADAIAFGKLFISNPDLPRRLELNAPLTPPDPATFYSGGERGYTDYPPLPAAPN